MKFLHNHPQLENKLNLGPEHVIVDHNEWQHIQKDINNGTYKPNYIKPEKSSINIISAKFIGADGSCGYKHGQSYVLNIHDIAEGINSPQISIERRDGDGKVEYSNVLTFLQNWADVTSH